MKIELCKKIEVALFASKLYLIKASSNNQWRDFHTRSSGAGGDWITAFVLSHSAADFPLAAEKFAEHLVGSRGIIGYNSDVPPDCDSSCWGLLALAFNGITIPEQLVAFWHAFIETHWTDDLRIGFSTYSKTSPIIAYKSEHGGWKQFDGWTKTGCNEITGLVFYTLCKVNRFKNWEQRAEQWIDSLMAEYSIKSYWWVSPMFAYRTIAQALHAITAESPRLTTKCHHLLSRIAKDVLCQYSLGLELSAFDCANQLLVSDLLLNIIEIDDATDLIEVIRKSLVGLIDCQLQDGSWCSDAIMRIPHPNDTEPWNSSYFSREVHGTGGILGDYGILSTAITRQAISTALRRIIIK